MVASNNHTSRLTIIFSVLSASLLTFFPCGSFVYIYAQKQSTGVDPSF